MARLADYFRKRANLSEEYARGLQKLNRQFAPAIPREFGYRLIPFAMSLIKYRMCDLLSSTDKIVGAHLLLVEQVNKSLQEGIRVTARDHDRSRREILSSIRSQRNDWKKTLASFEKTKKSRDAAVKAAEEARLVFERANADLNVTKAFVEKMREEYAAKARKTLVYKEEYIQAARSIRSLQKQHYDKDLALLFDKLQKVEEQRMQKTKLHLGEFGGLLVNALNEELVSLRSMMSKWDRLVPHEVLQDFIDEIREDGPFEYPEVILLDDMASVETLGIITKRSNSLSQLSRQSSTSKILLSDSPDALKQRLEDLEKEIPLLEKQRDGAQVLSDLYSKQPELATEQTLQAAANQLADLSDLLDALHIEQKNLQTRLRSIAADACDKLRQQSTDTIVMADEPVTTSVIWGEDATVANNSAQPWSPLQSPAPGGPNGYLSSINTSEALDKKDAIDMAVTLGQATALFDFDPRDSERELEVKSGDLLTILADEGEWWHARRGDGRTGYVPFNFIRPL